MPTRNSSLWWFGIGAALITFFASHFGLIHEAFPNLPTVWESRFRLLAEIVGMLSALGRMSPFALSSDSTLAGYSEPKKTLGIVNLLAGDRKT